MYSKSTDLIQAAVENNCKLSDIVLENECKVSEKSKEEVKSKLKNILNVMIDAAKRGLEEEVKSVSGLTGGDAKKVYSYSTTGESICGDTITMAMARALSCSEVNAAMGRIVAAPTAGSCGIIPAALITAAKKLEANEDQIIAALLTATGVGQIIAKNATLAGAEGGCQAECGSAAAMAAAALVEMYGGSPEASFHAAAITLKNVMGLICDPVAGLVEAPCAMRNAMGVVNAMISADLALAGVKSLIPFDEVVDAMYKVGRMLPEQLRETAMGGIATTPTGLKLDELVKTKGK